MTHLTSVPMGLDTTLHTLVATADGALPVAMFQDLGADIADGPTMELQSTDGKRLQYKMS